MPEDNDDQTPDEDYVPRSQIKDLEDKAKRATDALAENVALKRQLAFAGAGLPADDPKLPYFMEGYKGDLTPTAIRSEAERAGFLPSQTPPTQSASSEPAPDLAAHSRVAAASAGAASGPATADFLQKLSECKSQAEVMALCAQTQYPEGPYMSTSWNNQ